MSVHKMKYLLFANNKDLINFKYSYILLSFLNPEDIIVTFNHCLPLNTILNKINHQNIYHFSRQSFNRQIPYSGLDIVDNNKNKFTKIFLWPHPESIGNKENTKKVREYLKSHISLQVSDICHMPGFGRHQLTEETKKFLAGCYTGNTNLSTGLVGYLYIHQIKKPEDEIYLIGYSHSMNIDKHNWEGERDFFTQEQEKGRCRMIPLKL